MHLCRAFLKKIMGKNNIVVRYLVATLGLILVALGVALSLKSNLGTAPVSCPPAVLNLKWTAISFGTFTWMMHIIFIILQMIMRRKVLDVHYLLQLLAAFVFGYLCDACIWLLKDVEITSYLMKIVLILAAVILTAVGIRLEVISKAWILAGDKVVDVFSEVTGPVHEADRPAGGQGLQAGPACVRPSRSSRTGCCPSPSSRASPSTSSTILPPC